MLYVLENNGVYGLTKGQFSASADPGSLSKKGEANTMERDRRLPAGADARRDVRRAQLLGRQGAARADPQGRRSRTSGFAFVDVISPCVTFNDHEGSTKSYAYTRENNVEVVQADFVPPAAAITDRLRARHGAAT